MGFLEGSEVGLLVGEVLGETEGESVGCNVNVCNVRVDCTPTTCMLCLPFSGRNLIIKKMSHKDSFNDRVIRYCIDCYSSVRGA